MVGDGIGTHSARPGRILGLDLLRAVAAWLVLLSHVAFWTGAGDRGVTGGLAVRGELGVAIFFALSAFLLSAPFVRRGLGVPTRWSPRRYLVRRAARILPAYLLALAAVVVVAAVLGGAAASVLDLPTVLVHLVIGQGWTGRTFQSFTQAWSLTTEVAFYLVLPLVAAAAARLTVSGSPAARGRRMLVLSAATAVLGLLAQTLSAVVPDPRWAGVLATSALGHAAWFAVGVAVCVLVESEHVGAPLSTRAAVQVLRTSPGTLTLLAVVLWLVAATPLAGPRGVEPSTALESLAAEVLYGLIAACLLLAGTARGATEALVTSPAAGAVRWLGEISYPVFLWHVLVLQVLFAAMDLRLFDAPFVPVLVLVTVLSVGLGHLSWTLVESPVLDRTHRATAVPEPQPAARG